MPGAVEVAGVSVPERTVRLALTVATVVTVALVYRLIHASEAYAEQYFSEPAVESGQEILGVLVMIAGVGLLVDVWGGSDRVLDGLAFATLDETTVSRIVVTLGLLASAYLVTRLTKRVIQTLFEGDRLSVHQREIGHHVIQVGVYGTATLVVLSLWQVPLGRLLIGAGAATIVLGLAARQTLGAVLAGFVLLVSRPFDIGDWVVVDDKEGIVRDINIVKTRIRTFDDEQVMIPNDRITQADIVNRSRDGQLRVRMEVRVDYEADITRAVTVAREAMREVATDPILEDPAPEVVVRRLEPSAVILELRVWIGEPSARRKWAAKTAVGDAVTRRLQEEGIEIPFPKREFAAAGADDGTGVGLGDGRLVVDGDDLDPEATRALAALVGDRTSDPDDGGDD